MAYVSLAIAILFLVLGIVLAIASAVRLPAAIRRMAATRRLYGSRRSWLAYDVFHYAALGPLAICHAVRNGWLLVGVAAFGADLYIRWVEGLLADWNHWALWIPFVLGLLLWRWALYLELAVPPAALLLGPSCPEIERELASLNEELRPYRTLALIRPDQEPLPDASRRSVFLNNFRTRDLYQWRTVVFHLMDVVPILILCDGPTEPVKEEKRRIERWNYWDRTILTGRERLGDPEERSRLRAAVAERLARVDDQAARDARQAKFSSIRQAVSPVLWYPVDILQFMWKATNLATHAHKEFCRECKAPGSYESGDLPEDMPSLVGREEERRYLRESRTLEEIEIVLKSVDEVIQKERDPQWDFNRANVVNKWGQLASMRQEWDEARTQMEKAIAMFERFFPQAPPDLRKQTLQELGTACFNLGDVWLAQYRESNVEEHRERARVCYERSIEYDSLFGSSVALAARRLAALENPQVAAPTEDRSPPAAAERTARDARGG